MGLGDAAGHRVLDSWPAVQGAPSSSCGVGLDVDDGAARLVRQPDGHAGAASFCPSPSHLTIDGSVLRVVGSHLTGLVDRIHCCITDGLAASSRVVGGAGQGAGVTLGLGEQGGDICGHGAGEVLGILGDVGISDHGLGMEAGCGVGAVDVAAQGRLVMGGGMVAVGVLGVVLMVNDSPRANHVGIRRS